MHRFPPDSLKALLRRGLRRAGFELRRVGHAVEPPAAIKTWRALIEWRGNPGQSEVDHFVRTILPHMERSSAQMFQDLFVLDVLGGMRGGFFVEFGATDGVSLSNTYLLEQDHGWRGILAEPARGWHAALGRNRPHARIDKRCVWTRSGEQLVFNETPSREISTIDAFSSADGHAAGRATGERYEVVTVSLTDLLAEHGAPALIDYLSIDTEGSEYDILAAHDWARFRFRVITVEHNFTAQRERIQALLVRQGYRRAFTELSLWDDWYVLADGDLRR
jgi:FkbM family methyltransferase